MNAKTVTNHYELTRLLSKNNIAESWEAINLHTRRKCFLKISNPDSDLGPDVPFKVLNKSYQLQQLIHTTRILHATAKQRLGKTLIIEYPFLDSLKWQQLDERLFWQFFPLSLVQMCLIVDYLHLFGIVYCDLSLNNFLINISNNHPKIKLADLDFVVANGTRSKATLFGTPEHIAPEIMQGDIITNQADNYSMGVLIKYCLENTQSLKSIKIDESQREKLSQLAVNLTFQNAHIRPVNLIDALHQSGIISHQVYTSSTKTLLGMLLVTLFFKYHRRITSGDKWNLTSILKQHRIWGLPDEFLADLTGCYIKNPPKAFEIVKYFIKEARAERIVDYWQVRSDDNLLAHTYSQLGEIDANCQLELANTSIRQSINRVNAIIKKGGFLKAYLLYRNIIEVLDSEDGIVSKPARIAALRQSILAADESNRLDESFSFQNRLLTMLPEGSEEHFELLKQIILRYFYHRDTVNSSSLINKGYQLAIDSNNEIWRLEFNRLGAWALSAKAKYDQAVEILTATLEASKANSYYPIIINCYNDLGAVFWRRGDTVAAKEYYGLAFEIAKKNNLIDSAIPAMANLAMYYFEISEPKKAIKYLNTVLKNAVKPVHKAMRPILLIVKCESYLKLGKYDKAQNLLHEYLQCISLSNNVIFYCDYYYHIGWIKMHQGDLDSAESYLYKALHIPEIYDAQKMRTKLLHVISELNLIKGRTGECLSKLREAKAIAHQTKDGASQAEINLTEELIHFYYSDKTDSSRLIPCYKELLRHMCYYSAATCLIHLCAHDLDIRSKIDSAPLSHLIRTSPTPLFRALNLLVNDTPGTADKSVEQINAYKDAYKILESYGNVWLSAILCYKIANLYTSQNNDLIAHKYLNQSTTVLRGLGNESLATRFGGLAKRLKDHKISDEGRLSSFLSISEILKNIADYGSALEKIVKFAIEETGCERGALLLYSKDNEELHVKSYIECDSQSLADIKSLSRNIPKLSLDNISPLMIDNAQKDPRTKDFKSVYMHNIRSVLCIPITSKDKVHGILYLDHHTIPALFSRDDLTFANSLGNFLALMIETIQRYKFSLASASQSISDLNQLGISDVFITADNSVKELLTSLPDLAKTNTSILLLGESGTGKEIIAQMIHKNSLRADQALIKLNCAAIPPTLIESELFGIVKGVATGIEERKGKFEIADQGTLLLDEIGDMPFEIQAKVLRALEYQEFERVGSHRTISTDIRFIYATNKDLSKMIENGHFREDLYHRINKITIEIPPLRDRPNDIILLVDHFIKVFIQNKAMYPRIPATLMDRLLSYRWPGNVRELRNLIERLCITKSGKVIQLHDLPANIIEADQKGIDKSKSELIEKTRINEALINHNWNQLQTAKSLKMSLSTLRRRIKKYGIMGNL